MQISRPHLSTIQHAHRAGLVITDENPCILTSDIKRRAEPVNLDRAVPAGTCPKLYFAAVDCQKTSRTRIARDLKAGERAVGTIAFD